MNQEKKERVIVAVREYAQKNSSLIPEKYHLDFDSSMHIYNIGATMLMHKWDEGEYAPGSFVKAVLDNDLNLSFAYADGINRECLHFYVVMLYNMGYVN